MKFLNHNHCCSELLQKSSQSPAAYSILTSSKAKPIAINSTIAIQTPQSVIKAPLNMHLPSIDRSCMIKLSIRCICLLLSSHSVLHQLLHPLPFGVTMNHGLMVWNDDDFPLQCSGINYRTIHTVRWPLPKLTSPECA